MNFEILTDLPIPARTPDLVFDIYQKTHRRYVTQGILEWESMHRC